MAKVYSSAPRRGSVLSGILQTLLIIAITVALILVFLEIGLRLFAPQIVAPLSGLFQPDPQAGYRLRSNVSVHYRSSEADVTFHTGGDPGMRVVPPATPAGANQTILNLGDSFTFGMNVQDAQAYPSVMKANLAGSGNSRWDVLNGGVFGYGTDNEAAWLKEYGWQYNPKLVVVGFFVGNDVKDVMVGITKTVATSDGRLVATAASTTAMGQGDEDTQAPKSTGIKGWLESNSHAYLFLRSLWYNTLGKRSGKPQKLTIFDAASFYEKDVPPEIQAGWNKTFDVLKSIQADCQAHNAQLVLVAIPTREQVYASSWDDVKAQFGLKDADFDLGLPQQKLADFSKAQGISYIDLLPDFKAQNSNANLYFQIDRHWTAAGQRLAAEAILRELQKQGLVK